MKVSINDIELFTLNDTQKSVISNDIPSDILEDDIKRRVQYVVMHKYEQCFERLKKEWEPKLAKAGAQFIPTDKDAFARMVFDHPEYRDRKSREAK